MTGQTNANDAAPLSETVSQSASFVPRAATVAVWVLFVLSAGVLALVVTGGELSVGTLFVVDGLTAVMWVVVTFFSGIVHSYSRRYMAGDARVEAFFARIFAFTLVVVTMAAADHVALFAGAWLAMGLVMASLVGHVRGWQQARAAASVARRHFLASSGLLAVGLAALVWATGATSITGILGQVETIPRSVALVAVGSIVLAAMIQSALFPFHTWLLSSMTAPTPASALMHAGFVNAGGILLTRFAPLLADEPAVMSLVVAVGALSALLGQALLLVQTDVKRKLGASTMAQMGFMILQCGLGFFAAAIAHLVLHGFYKAYLFLSSGEAVEQTAPKAAKDDRLTLAGVAVGLLTAVGGGALFAVLTGKGTELNSGLVLALVVVLTTMHATRDVLRRSTLSPVVRLLSVPLVVLTAIGAYGLLFNAVSAVIADAPMAAAPTELTVVHVAVAALFVLSYLATELGWHRSSERLYVELVNRSQPDSNTILTSTEDYNDA
ncbi:NADH dehydrogenase (quinone) [Halosimplex carlsbadense 2-9-1]|uniref:NADH dehydrogenase (Quinone) n=1 Tax=Halosimplex carlsbadense 2-9-1 TaxID=797114 RepID=M0CPH1_9EURY|nr:proton-conducting transporter membrane subunit [Halosimplex carlsbadense]ELZ24297.1 NADH dehydrogenase (quinone) [Halosimplex carlsbadense 2-9-1]